MSNDYSKAGTLQECCVAASGVKLTRKPQHSPKRERQRYAPAACKKDTSNQNVAARTWSYGMPKHVTQSLLLARKTHQALQLLDSAADEKEWQHVEAEERDPHWSHSSCKT